MSLILDILKKKNQNIWNNLKMRFWSEFLNHAPLYYNIMEHLFGS